MMDPVIVFLIMAAGLYALCRCRRANREIDQAVRDEFHE